MTAGDPDECPSATVCECEGDVGAANWSAESRDIDLKVHLPDSQRFQ